MTTNLYVSTSGSDSTGNGSSANPYADLQSALAAVTNPSATVINIGAGTYDVPSSGISLTSVFDGLTIEGAGNNFNADSGPLGETLLYASGSAGALLLNGAQNISVQDVGFGSAGATMVSDTGGFGNIFAVDSFQTFGTATTASAAVALSEATGDQISSSGFGVAGLAVQQSGGSYNLIGSFSSGEFNRIYAESGPAISVSLSSTDQGNIIDNNEINLGYDVTGPGAVVSVSGGVGTSILNNGIDAAGGTGIALSDASLASISNNNITGFSAYGIYADNTENTSSTTGTSITGNVIEAGGTAATDIYVLGGTTAPSIDTTINLNFITNTLINTPDILLANNASYVNVTNNIIQMGSSHGANAYAVDVQGGSNITINNDVIDEGSYGYDSGVLFQASSSYANTMADNSVTNNEFTAEATYMGCAGGTAQNYDNQNVHIFNASGTDIYTFGTLTNTDGAAMQPNLNINQYSDSVFTNLNGYPATQGDYQSPGFTSTSFGSDTGYNPTTASLTYYGGDGQYHTVNFVDIDTSLIGVGA